MEEKRLTVEELKQLMAADLDQLAQEVTEAMNTAQDGHIIADTEELVRQAHAVFRERLYEKAIGLLQKKQEGLFPSDFELDASDFRLPPIFPDRRTANEGSRSGREPAGVSLSVGRDNQVEGAGRDRRVCDVPGSYLAHMAARAACSAGLRDRGASNWRPTL